MQQETPLHHMFHTFIVFIVVIISAVAIFNFIIFKGKIPSSMAYYSFNNPGSFHNIGESCNAEDLCYEPLQCVSNICALIVTDKGNQCNNRDLICESPFFCDKEICKQQVDLNQNCDEYSFQVCNTSLECLDGVCRKINIQ